jgi:hypothetical protein
MCCEVAKRYRSARGRVKFSLRLGVMSMSVRGEKRVQKQRPAVARHRI